MRLADRYVADNALSSGNSDEDDNAGHYKSDDTSEHDICADHAADSSDQD
jgi:hypothetical protein